MNQKQNAHDQSEILLDQPITLPPREFVKSILFRSTLGDEDKVEALLDYFRHRQDEATGLAGATLPRRW